ncbi:biotin--[acetyl-CoA-carboxylase] ligase, partial [Butyrivibrio sp. AE3004]|uniref:biotin--[acetyl-CoA-carboxylase] ligase n=1 Tax=Butyrivibrio sp. AE3004 TaxID=1506994 RepID=UPI0004940C9B
MNIDKIRTMIDTRWVAKEVSFFDIIDSTNNVAKAAGDEGRQSGFLAVADRQDAGRGSRGRKWISPSGYNIFMSLMIRPKIPMDKAAGLTLIMALSIAEAIDEVAGVKTNIKWPNDIVLNKRKICGILTELHMEPDQKDYFVVIGAGINVNQPIELFPEEIRNTAGSVFSETGNNTDRAALIGACMKHFESNYENYVKAQDLRMLKNTYESRLINIGKEVRILDPKGEYEAVADGITDEGALVVTCKDGRRTEINAGEVSVRGLYGYV